MLIETTELRLSEVAFAAGFASIRQFNETVQAVFARTPTELRRRAGRVGTTSGPAGSLELRLARREPFAGDALLEFLGQRAVPGLEAYVDGVFHRSLSLTHGDGVVSVSMEADCVRASLRLDDLRDLSTAVSRCRRLFDLDADPVAIDATLRADPMLAPMVRDVPGRRVAGTVDGTELAVRAIIGQQVSVAGARTVAASLVAALGRPLSNPWCSVTATFPSAEVLAGAATADFAMPTARAEAIITLAGAVAAGSVVIDAGADPARLHDALLSIRGIGPWTASYIAMRALGDPDAFLPTDLGLRRAALGLERTDDPASLLDLAERWRPWRAYAMAHLWNAQPRLENAA